MTPEESHRVAPAFAIDGDEPMEIATRTSSCSSDWLGILRRCGACLLKINRARSLTTSRTPRILHSCNHNGSRRASAHRHHWSLAAPAAAQAEFRCANWIQLRRK
eukprot:5583049-Amphidinium_carterae.1